MSVMFTKATAKRIGRATLQVERTTGVPGTQSKNDKFPGVHAIYRILLTETVAAATWDDATRKLTPSTFTAHLMYAHADAAEDDDGSLTYHDSDFDVTGKSYYTTAVSVSSGKGRLAELVDGRLFVADCSEIDLPSE